MSHVLNRVSVSPAFVLWMTCLLLSEKGDAAAAILSAAILHEMGHLLALRIFRIQITGLRIGILGAELKTRGREKLSYGREAVVLLAGPAVNGISIPILLFAANMFDWPEGTMLAGAHFLLALFNLLPVLPLDGGRILQVVLTCLLGPAAGEIILMFFTVGILFCLAGTAVFLRLKKLCGNWLLLSAMGFLGIGFNELGLVKSHKNR